MFELPTTKLAEIIRMKKTLFKTTFIALPCVIIMIRMYLGMTQESCFIQKPLLADVAFFLLNTWKVSLFVTFQLLLALELQVTKVA